MRPVYQTITKLDPENGQWGDCLRACIASLFEMDIEGVPHFCDERAYPEGHYPAVQEWLKRRDLTMIAYPVPADKMEEHGEAMRALGVDCFYLVGGRSGLSNHVVVAQYGACVHDPYPKLDSPWHGHMAPDDNGNYEVMMIVKRFIS
jgi:hypothetical protein